MWLVWGIFVVFHLVLFWFFCCFLLFFLVWGGCLFAFYMYTKVLLTLIFCFAFLKGHRCLRAIICNKILRNIYRKIWYDYLQAKLHGHPTDLIEKPYACASGSLISSGVVLYRLDYTGPHQLESSVEKLGFHAICFAVMALISAVLFV